MFESFQRFALGVKGFTCSASHRPGLPSGDSNEYLNFTGLNATGTNYQILINYAVGDSTIEQFNPTGSIANETFDYSGTQGSGTDTENIINNDNGTSQVTTGTATVATTYTYDSLNRLTGKSYRDTYASNPSTATVSYAYDGVAPTDCTPPLDTDSYPTGRRTAMCDGSGGTSWIHDKMGRMLQERRTIGGVLGKYDTDTYNLDGSVASLTPMGWLRHPVYVQRRGTPAQCFELHCPGNEVREYCDLCTAGGTDWSDDSGYLALLEQAARDARATDTTRKDASRFLKLHINRDL